MKNLGQNFTAYKPLIYTYKEKGLINWVIENLGERGMYVEYFAFSKRLINSHQNAKVEKNIEKYNIDKEYNNF